MNTILQITNGRHGKYSNTVGGYISNIMFEWMEMREMRSCEFWCDIIQDDKY